MSTLREQLVLRALAALQEIADECGAEPARRNLSLRFLLAYTYVAAGARPDVKWIWTHFWNDATSPRTEFEHERLMDGYVRGTGARSALNGICREIGYPPDNEFLRMLRAMGKVRKTSGRGNPRSGLRHDNDEPIDDDAA